MPQYDIAFARKLAEIAKDVAPDIGELTDGADRAAAYLSLVAIEIGLKAMLEQAGVPIDKIRARSHRIRELLEDVDKIRVEVVISPEARIDGVASRLRAIPVHFANAVTTVGEMLDAQGILTSTYPNEIRYGDLLINFPSRSLAFAAIAVIDFAESHWESLRT